MPCNFASLKQNTMTKITVAKGDGIGPEIMDATLDIILAAGAKIEIEEIKQIIKNLCSQIWQKQKD